MKTCPYCLATNRDDATACYACGRDLVYASGASSNAASRTQPVRPPTGPGSTQPLHFPPPGQQSQSQAQPGYPSAPTYPPSYAPTGSTAPVSPAPQPTYPGAQPTYPQQPQYPPPVYPAPPPPPAPPPDPTANSPFLPWPVMIGTVVLLILCVCGLASWGLTSATFGGAGRLSDRVSTQVADVFGGPAASATPTEPPDTPTPWPTFTPAPTDTPLPTSTPMPTETPAPLPTSTGNPTQQASLEKLLSPECKAALDSMQEVSGEATQNPARLLDGEWRSAFGSALDAMKTRCGTLESASPVPGEISDVRHNLDQASASFDQAKQLFNEGVDQRDPGKLLEAGQSLQKALDSLGKAIAGLRKIGQ